MTEAEESSLVGAARGGSAAAFARLVARHQGAVRAFLRRVSGNHADADDLAQEAFVTAWTRLASFRPEGSLRSWLCGIAYRKWLTHRRGAYRRAEREQGEAPETEVRPSSDARLDVQSAMAGLAPDVRAAVALCLAADFSHAEAAQALGLPLGTVKSHVARGRARLLQLLGESDERG